MGADRARTAGREWRYPAFGIQQSADTTRLPPVRRPGVVRLVFDVAAGTLAGLVAAAAAGALAWLWMARQPK